MSYAVKCPCGHPSCKHWHVEPEAAVQGVNFTEEQAHLVASTLNASREPRSDRFMKVSKTKLEFEAGNLVKVDGMRPEYMDGNSMIALIRLLAVKLLKERNKGAGK